MGSPSTRRRASSGAKQNGHQATEDNFDFGMYRTTAEIPLASSMPNSPMPNRVQQRNSSPIPDPADMDVSGDSPTKLLETFENVCVSPEKKRPKVDGRLARSPSISSVASSHQYTLEEKMAPWSPTKSK
jgi:hypothetical protein